MKCVHDDFKVLAWTAGWLLWPLTEIGKMLDKEALGGDIRSSILDWLSLRYTYILIHFLCASRILMRTCYHGSYKKVFLEELNCLNKVEHWVLGLAMWPSLIADMTKAISMEGCKPYWRELKRKWGIVEYSNYRIFASSDVSAKENEEMEKLQEWKQRKLS